MKFKLPKPVRDELLEHALAAVRAGFEAVTEATDENSDGGKQITRAERKLIGRFVFRALVDGKVPDPTEVFGNHPPGSLPIGALDAAPEVADVREPTIPEPTSKEPS